MSLPYVVSTLAIEQGLAVSPTRPHCAPVTCGFVVKSIWATASEDSEYTPTNGELQGSELRWLAVEMTISATQH